MFESLRENIRNRYNCFIGKHYYFSCQVRETVKSRGRKRKLYKRVEKNYECYHCRKKTGWMRQSQLDKIGFQHWTPFRVKDFQLLGVSIVKVPVYPDAVIKK